MSKLESTILGFAENELKMLLVPEIDLKDISEDTNVVSIGSYMMIKAYAKIAHADSGLSDDIRNKLLDIELVADRKMTI